MSVCLIRPAIDEGNIFYVHDKLAPSQDVSSISLEGGGAASTASLMQNGLGERRGERKQQGNQHL